VHVSHVQATRTRSGAWGARFAFGPYPEIIAIGLKVWNNLEDFLITIYLDLEILKWAIEWPTRPQSTNWWSGLIIPYDLLFRDFVFFLQLFLFVVYFCCTYYKYNF
jgi:hypothetical protein